MKTKRNRTNTVAMTIIVDTVDGSGGITAAHIGEAGSYSALPAGHVAVTGGTGSGATFDLLWSILSVAISNAGDGYQETPVPYVTTYTTSYRMAKLTAVMSAADAPMTLSASKYKVLLSSVSEYADDAAAAAGGLSVGDIYRTGSIIKLRAS